MFGRVMFGPVVGVVCLAWAPVEAELLLAFAVAHKDGTADLFVARDKVGDDVAQHLGNAVTVRPRLEFEHALAGLSGKSVAVDPDYGVAAISVALEEAGATVTGALGQPLTGRGLQPGDRSPARTADPPAHAGGGHAGLPRRGNRLPAQG